MKNVWPALLMFYCNTVFSQQTDFKPYTQTLGATEFKIEMVAIPAGEFMMGSDAKEKGRNEDEGKKKRGSCVLLKRMRLLSQVPGPVFCITARAARCDVGAALLLSGHPLLVGSGDDPRRRGHRCARHRHGLPAGIDRPRERRGS